MSQSLDRAITEHHLQNDSLRTNSYTHHSQILYLLVYAFIGVGVRTR